MSNNDSALNISNPDVKGIICKGVFSFAASLAVKKGTFGSAERGLFIKPDKSVHQKYLEFQNIKSASKNLQEIRTPAEKNEKIIEMNEKDAFKSIDNIKNNANTNTNKHYAVPLSKNIVDRYFKSNNEEKYTQFKKAVNLNKIISKESGVPYDGDLSSFSGRSNESSRNKKYNKRNKSVYNEKHKDDFHGIEKRDPIGMPEISNELVVNDFSYQQVTEIKKPGKKELVLDYLESDSEGETKYGRITPQLVRGPNIPNQQKSTATKNNKQVLHKLTQRMHTPTFTNSRSDCVIKKIHIINPTENSNFIEKKIINRQSIPNNDSLGKVADSTEKPKNETPESQESNNENLAEKQQTLNRHPNKSRNNKISGEMRIRIKEKIEDAINQFPDQDDSIIQEKQTEINKSKKNTRDHRKKPNKKNQDFDNENDGDENAENIKKRKSHENFDESEQKYTKKNHIPEIDDNDQNQAETYDNQENSFKNSKLNLEQNDDDECEENTKDASKKPLSSTEKYNVTQNRGRKLKSGFDDYTKLHTLRSSSVNEGNTEIKNSLTNRNSNAKLLQFSADKNNSRGNTYRDNKNTVENKSSTPRKNNKILSSTPRNNPQNLPQNKLTINEENKDENSIKHSENSIQNNELSFSEQNETNANNNNTNHKNEKLFQNYSISKKHEEPKIIKILLNEKKPIDTEQNLSNTSLNITGHKEMNSSQNSRFSRTSEKKSHFYAQKLLQLKKEPENELSNCLQTFGTVVSILFLAATICYLALGFVSAFDKKGKEAYFSNDQTERTLQSAVSAREKDKSIIIKTDDWGYFQRTYYENDARYSEYNVFLWIILTCTGVGSSWLLSGIFEVYKFVYTKWESACWTMCADIFGLVIYIAGNIIIIPRIVGFRSSMDGLWETCECDDVKNQYYLSSTIYLSATAAAGIIGIVQLIASIAFFFSNEKEPSTTPINEE